VGRRAGAGGRFASGAEQASLGYVVLARVQVDARRLGLAQAQQRGLDVPGQRLGELAARAFRCRGRGPGHCPAP